MVPLSCGNVGPRTLGPAVQNGGPRPSFAFLETVGTQPSSIGSAFFVLGRRPATSLVAFPMILFSKKGAFPRIRTGDGRIPERKSYHCTIQRIAVENYIFI
jgi:hypothetical protein